MKLLRLFSALIVTASSTLLLGQEPARTRHPQAPSAEQAPSTGQDQQFIKQATLAGLMEVEAGRVALEKATNQQCKEFAQMVVKVHSDSNERLKSIAQSKGMNVPTAPDDTQRKMLDKLSGKSGAAFDRAFADMMVKDHQKAVALFEREEQSGSDNELKNFARETLPTLKAHLKMAQELQASSKTSSRTPDQ